MAQGSAVLFAAQVIGNAGFFAAVLILARGLGPAGRGAVAFFIVTTMVTARAAGIGVREATTVFAKAALAAHCATEGVVHIRFDGLADVAVGIEEYVRVRV